MNRGKSLLQALSTVLARDNWPGFRAYGRYVPYLYPQTLLPLAQHESLHWLAERMQGERDSYLAVLRDAQQYAALFGSWKTADANDVNRPRFNQLWFAGLDAAMAYASVRRLKPKRIIEVGSGHSTRFLARAIADAQLGCELHSIDPQPRREIDPLCERIVRQSVTEVDVNFFASLAANDVLFIDGSHALLPGSDVDYLFTRILPDLRSGVVVHIHDIFLPYGYPLSWHRRNYTEQSILAALLAGGSKFEILSPNAWLRRNETAAVEAVGAHLQPGGFEASFWLRVN